jgi:DNA-binding MarR family transcriptional regulator
MLDKSEMTETIDRTAHKYELNLPEKTAFAALLLAANGGTECSLTVGEIAGMCGRSVGWVRRTLRSLEEKELIIREAQYYDLERTERAENKYILQFGERHD